MSNYLLQINTHSTNDIANAFDRCVIEKGLYLQKGFVNKSLQNIVELWRVAKENNGLIEVINNKNKTVYGLSVSWLREHLGADDTHIEIQPCIGQPMYLKSSDLNNATGRYLLLRRPHDELKLVDTSISTKNPIIRGIHLIRTYR